MAYVSCGRLDGYYHNHILPWDVAAGQLLVEEANGRVTDFSGRPFQPLDNDKTIVATNGFIHDGLLARLASSAT
jgi:myo-inositol-1(or 4)-monophosphatase